MTSNCLDCAMMSESKWRHFGRKCIIVCISFSFGLSLLFVVLFVCVVLLSLLSSSFQAQAQELTHNRKINAIKAVWLCGSLTSSQVTKSCQFSFLNTFHLCFILSNHPATALDQALSPSCLNYCHSFFCRQSFSMLFHPSSTQPP